MGKFARLLKDSKWLAGNGNGRIGSINNLYKSIKLAVDTAVCFFPDGGVINQILDQCWKEIDKTQNYTKDCSTDTDRKRLNSMNKTGKKLVIS